MRKKWEKKEDFNLSRREFLSGPLLWITKKAEANGSAEPVPFRIPLKALRHVPVSALMSVTPVLRHGWSIHICETGIACEEASGGERIIQLSPECRHAVHYFDGTKTLNQIAAILNSELNISKEKSVSTVHYAFLSLAELEVYHPDKPLDPSLILTALESQNA